MVDYNDPEVVERQNVSPNAGWVIDGVFYDVRDCVYELATLRAENERLTAALMNPDMEVLESICCGRDAYASELADMLYSYWEALK